MEDNPFSALVNSIRDDNKKQSASYYRLGTVISVEPFMVDVAGTSQDEGAFLKNSMLNFFEEGDRLLLMPIEDEQRYIIICKVVNT